jgi:hypothetical protein
MKIHLVALHDCEMLSLLRLGAVQSAHVLVEDPGVADMIVLLGDFGRKPELLLSNSVYRAYREKCAVYTEDDIYLPLAPGVYCSAQVDRHSRAGRAFSASYYSQNGRFSNRFVAPAEATSNKKFLFSFMGGSTSMLRKRLFNLDYRRPDVLIENTSTYWHWDTSQPDRKERQLRYARTIATSHFVLCPRGAGSGSIRLFEVMSAGIAPVLIADDYLLPENVDWNSFLLRIRQKDIARLPELLEPHRESSAERGKLAREAWLKHFAPEHGFERIMAGCWAALHHGPPSEAIFLRRQRPMILASSAYRTARGLARSITLKSFKLLRLKLPFQMNR